MGFTSNLESIDLTREYLPRNGDKRKKEDVMDEECSLEFS